MKTLNTEESMMIYALLKAEQRPLDEIASDFKSKLPSARHFVACSSLVFLLQAMSPQFLSQQSISCFILGLGFYDFSMPFSHSAWTFAARISKTLDLLLIL